MVNAPSLSSIALVNQMEREQIYVEAAAGDGPRYVPRSVLWNVNVPAPLPFQKLDEEEMNDFGHGGQSHESIPVSRWLKFIEKELTILSSSLAQMN